MRDPSQQPGEDPLRNAVREALETRVDELSVARLERFWQEAGRRELTRTRRRGVLAAAALVLAAVGISAWWWPADSAGPVEVVQEQEVPESPSIDPPTEPAWRAPTAYEVAAFYSQSPRRPGAAAVAVDLNSAQPEVDTPPTIDQQIETLLAGPPADAARRFARLQPKGEAYAALARRADDRRVAVLLAGLVGVRSEHGRPKQMLAATSPAVIDGFFAGLSAEEPDERRTAAVVLGRIGGQDVTHRLIDAIADNPRNAAAWWSLANTQTAAAQEFFEYAAQQPRLLGFLNAAQARWSAGAI